eukprot:1826875-Rhodomonas_salina.1
MPYLPLGTYCTDNKNCGNQKCSRGISPGGTALPVTETQCGGLVSPPCSDYMHGNAGGEYEHVTHCSLWYRAAAGGGGAGAPAPDTVGGWGAEVRDRSGGDGLLINITGNNYWWAGGGGGATRDAGNRAGDGGAGGGGAGGGSYEPHQFRKVPKAVISSRTSENYATFVSALNEEKTAGIVCAAGSCP